MQILIRRVLKAILGRIYLMPVGMRIGLAVVSLAVVSIGAFQGNKFYDYTQNDPTFCLSCHTMQAAWEKWNTSEHSKVNCHNCHLSNPMADLQQVYVYALNKPDKVENHAIVKDAACEKCHESGDPTWRQVASTAGHRIHNDEAGIACTKCHSVTLHRFKPPKELCKACHEDKKILVTQMAERYCLDCHNFLRPDSPLRPARETCLSCHQKLPQTKITWPEDAPMKFVCSDCHKPHESAMPTVVCTSCHNTVKNQGLHQRTTHLSVTCQTCHKPHAWKVTTRDVCEACHADKKSHNSGIVCSSCHDYKKIS